MFTGIVQAVGAIRAATPQGDGLRLVVDAAALSLDDVAIGNSIAINGCCMTVVRVDQGNLHFDASAETLRCTAGFAPGGNVNLEKALRLSDRLGGHLMSGHVDGVGMVSRFLATDSADAGGSFRLEVAVAADLHRFIAPKGSIAVDGVSLTVNDVDQDCFGVNLIPHTLAVTTFKTLSLGQRVNIEVDIIARYVARLHGPRD